ncbi:MAG: hypothetical protein ABIV94_02605, partial [Acidimicrobiales bacterium]
HRQRRVDDRRPLVNGSRIAAAIAASALVLVVDHLAVPDQPAPPAPAPVTARPAPGTITTTNTPTSCQEDDPCWDCSTMGNHVCGPTVTVEAGR